MLVLLTLAGVGLGVHFGRAAVNDIDPFYFTDPQGTHSYAALTPYFEDAEQAMDGLAEYQVIQTHIAGGVVKGAAGIVNFGTQPTALRAAATIASGWGSAASSRCLA